MSETVNNTAANQHLNGIITYEEGPLLQHHLKLEYVVMSYHDWENHPDEPGHGPTNVLSLHIHMLHN